MGHAVSQYAMGLAIEKAKASGVGIVTVRNSRHYGAAGVYSKRALEHDMIGLSLTNADALVLPTHGKQARLGTNPIAVAVPTGELAPFLLDMATSTVALGKVALARRAGEAIPLGWAADRDGRPTTDAAVALAALSLLPLGGSYEQGSHKGYGLATVVDIACGLLSGGGAGHAGALGTSVGHFFGALRIDAFLPVEEFKRAADSFLRLLLDTEPADPATPVIYPGVKEAAAREERQRLGVSLHREVVAYLNQLSAQQGLAGRL
jgi:LDH2 family malate/lactate/ureidoglycolate dehydrogenase